MSQLRKSADDSAPLSGAELTGAAILLGLILSVVMGAANVYLGLRAGMTVSASIPAAVIATGVFRGLLRRTSVLESNLVQTAASAGESLAAGIIFTMPALILAEIWTEFDYWVTSLIALSGGLLGILLMIPMRQVFVVDNTELKYPEGVACAEVLRAGDAEAAADPSDSIDGLRLIVGGIVVGGVFKFLQSFVGLLRGAAEAAMVRADRVFFVGIDISPALMAVGYIVTLPIAVQIFAGGFIGWLVAIPWLGVTGMEGESAVDLAYGLWSTKVRYLGVGAMIVGGISSIWQVRSGLAAAAKQLFAVMTRNHASESDDPTERNLSGGSIVALGAVCVTLIAGVYSYLLNGDVGLTILTTLVMLVMSFFFAAVASYIVGLVGNSNSPVSGMTITAVLATGALVWLFGFEGTDAIVATLGVAGIVCCVACTSGDVCNDLKTGHLIGASPRNQQLMQILGVGVAAFVMAPVLTVLHEGNAATGGIGGKELPAPQAGLFKALVDGFFSEKGNLPTDMVGYGVLVGILLLAADRILVDRGSSVRLHVMPVAVGIYLPLGLSTPILLGGLVRYFADRRRGRKDSSTDPGVLVTSGLIAGESLVGVLVGLLLYFKVAKPELGDRVATAVGLSETAGNTAWQLLSLAALLGVAAWTFVNATKRIK